MNRDERDAILGFIARFRRKLWLRGLHAPMLYAGGAGVAIMLSAGACNRFFHALPLLPSLGLAALPTLVVLSVNLVKFRPDTESAAIAADRLFAGKSLMTTALGLLGDEPAASPFAAHTLQRAARAAAAWNERLDELPGTSTGPWHWLLAATALAGVFLLILPGAPSPASSPVAESLPRIENLTEKPADLMARIASAEQPKPRPDERTTADPEQSGSGPPASDDSPVDGTGDDLKIPPNHPDKPGRDAHFDGGGPSQGEGVGAAADQSGPPRTAVVDVDLAQRTISLERSGGETRHKATVPFSDHKVIVAETANRHAPPASVTTSGKSGFSTISRARRHYVDAYFQMIDNQ